MLVLNLASSVSRIAELIKKIRLRGLNGRLPHIFWRSPRFSAWASDSFMKEVGEFTLSSPIFWP
jgi:REP element-mobilizing transposase RayT